MEIGFFWILILVWLRVVRFEVFMVGESYICFVEGDDEVFCIVCFFESVNNFWFLMYCLSEGFVCDIIVEVYVFFVDDGYF